MTLGRLLYFLYYRPMGFLKQRIREGGFIEWWKTERGRRQMEKAAAVLRCEASDFRFKMEHAATPKQFALHMLVGNRFWFMAAFALKSLQRRIIRPIRAHLYDDGTLGSFQRDRLSDLGVEVIIYGCTDIEARMEECLPEGRYPYIRERRRNLPPFKKLLDPHVGSSGAKLMMDADILFFDEPTELLEWFDNPVGMLCATDMQENYGYTRSLMEGLVGRSMPLAVNSGITGFKSESLDWDKLEYWCREMITREGTSYYLDQALVAMLCSQGPFVQLGAERYITGPSDVQVLDKVGVVQHYVDLSKKEYFRSAWREFVANP